MKSAVKKSGLFCLLCLGILLLINEDASAQSETNQKKETMENVQEKASSLQLSIDGMSCQAGCANSIDNMLGKQKGIIESKTLYSSSSSEILYDKDKISEKQIMDLIAQKGFKVEKSDKVKKSDK